jgi:hypothetical protein
MEENKEGRRAARARGRKRTIETDGAAVGNGTIFSLLSISCNLVSPSFFLDHLTLEDGTDRLSCNVGKQLPTYTA